MKREKASYFVTFRLYDSLPKTVLMKMQADRDRLLQEMEAGGPESQAGVRSAKVIEREYFRKVELCLDRGQGACVLKRPDIAQIVVDALRFFEGKRYLLSAWVIMPNHVHAVVWPMLNYNLSDVLRGWKRYTARQINKLLGMVGRSLWQPESYDHWIRDEDEFSRCCRYVINNPVKARLCSRPSDWRWSSAWQGDKPKDGNFAAP